MPLHYRENTTDEKVIDEILIKKAYKKKKIEIFMPKNLIFDLDFQDGRDL